MLKRSLHRWGVRAALATSVLLGGCLQVTRVAVIPQPVRLVSPDGFSLYEAQASGAVPVPACRVLRVDAIVEDVRADTLLLRDVRVRGQPKGAASCPSLRRVLVLSSRDTLVRSETRSANWLGTTALYLFGVIVMAFIYRSSL